MSWDPFDDSLDEILGAISVSQLLDASVGSDSNAVQRHKSCETQTDSYYTSDKNSISIKTVRKRKLVLVQTDKHHHKPCVYHQSGGQTQATNGNKKLRPNDSHMNSSDSSAGNDFVDINCENRVEMKCLNEWKSTDELSHSYSSSQTVLITNEDLFDYSADCLQTELNSGVTEDQSSQNAIQLINDWDLSSDSDLDSTSGKSMNLLETDEELDVQRSPLLQLNINGINPNDRPMLRPSQLQLITDEDLRLFKSQSSQNSNSSQSSNPLSIYE